MRERGARAAPEFRGPQRETVAAHRAPAPRQGRPQARRRGSLPVHADQPVGDRDVMGSSACPWSARRASWTGTATPDQHACRWHCPLPCGRAGRKGRHGCAGCIGGRLCRGRQPDGALKRAEGESDDAVEGQVRGRTDGHRHGGVPIQTGDDVIVAQCASEPQGCMAQVPPGRGPGGERARLLGPHAQALRLLHAARDEGALRARSWFHAPGSREALRPGTGTVTYVPNMLHRAAHRPHPGQTARHLLRHLHAGRPQGLRLAVARHHLREGRHRGRADGDPRGQREPAPDLRRHPPARHRRRPTSSSTPGGPDPARAPPDATELAIGGYIAELVRRGHHPARHRRHPQRRRAGARGQARPRGAHRDDGRLDDGALREGRHHQQEEGAGEGQVRLHLRHGLARLYDWLDDNMAVRVPPRLLGQRPGGDPPELQDGLASTPA